MAAEQDDRLCFEECFFQIGRSGFEDEVILVYEDWMGGREFVLL